MNEQWPPDAPNVKKAFQKSHDAEPDKGLTPPKNEIVTKKAMEDLEKTQRKTAAPQLVLNPPGMKLISKRDEDRKASIERMRQKLKQQGDKARDDFGKSASM